MTRKITLLFLCLCAACNTLKVDHKLQQITQQNLELGQIGHEVQGLTDMDFEADAIPVFKEQLRIGVSVNSFTKNSFKNYAKAAQKQQQKVTLQYMDSIDIKPIFITLTITDKVTLITALKEAENEAELDFIKTSEHPTLITGVSVVVAPNLQALLTQADAVYLIQTAQKKNRLQLYKIKKC